MKIMNIQGLKELLLPNKKGFSLVEALISLTIVGVVSVVSMPMVTQVAKVGKGVDTQTIKCINGNDTTNNATTGWYIDATGVSNISALADNTICKDAVMDVKYNRGDALKTAKWYAEHGTSSKQVMAKKILRTACDNGGNAACDFFVQDCWKSGSSSKCDDANNFLDLAYYLHQDLGGTKNVGTLLIKDKLVTDASSGAATIVGAVSNACNNNQLANDVDEDPSNLSGQNLLDNLACDIYDASLYIKACNRGNAAACEEAFRKNYNKSCYQIKDAWEDAPTGEYKLTYKGWATPLTITCNMTSEATAAISGCTMLRKYEDTDEIPEASYETADSDYCPTTTVDSTDSCSDDCIVGQQNFYNRTCAQIFGNIGVIDGYQAITRTVVDDLEADEVAWTNCVTNSACVLGALCDDGTVYAADFDGTKLYTTPVDSGATTYTWSTPPGTTTSLSGADGEANTADLLGRTAATDERAPYKAAHVCKMYKDNNYLGENDWFLPSVEQYKIILQYHDIIPNMEAIGFWTSNESSKYFAATATWRTWGLCANIGYYYQPKTTEQTVRCISAGPGTNCPNGGDKCDEGYYYAGIYNSEKMYITPNNVNATWDNGESAFTKIPTYDEDDGRVNHAILTSDSAALNIDAPYTAADMCELLNGMAYLGYDDWYLPAINEAMAIHDNRTDDNALAAVLVSNNTYWTSTARGDWIGYSFGMDRNGNSDSQTRNRVYRIFCVRRVY